MAKIQIDTEDLAFLFQFLPAWKDINDIPRLLKLLALYDKAQNAQKIHTMTMNFEGMSDGQAAVIEAILGKNNTIPKHPMQIKYPLYYHGHPTIPPDTVGAKAQKKIMDDLNDEIEAQSMNFGGDPGSIEGLMPEVDKGEYPEFKFFVDDDHPMPTTEDLMKTVLQPALEKVPLLSLYPTALTWPQERVRIVAPGYAFLKDKKIHAIKFVRAITGWGLKDAKDFVEDTTPSPWLYVNDPLELWNRYQENKHTGVKLEAKSY